MSDEFKMTAGNNIPPGFTIDTALKSAGTYCLGGVNYGISLHLRKKPRWLHRFMMRHFLGVEWNDA